MDSNPFTQVMEKLRSAALAWPDGQGWRDAALIFMAYMLLALPLGLGSGHLSLVWSQASWGKLVLFSAIALLAPALVEELFFRVILLPKPGEEFCVRSFWVWACLSLVLFVASHPLNAWLLRPSARPIFYDPIFLTLAGLLGLACTLAYQRTGSLWPAVGMHWITVVAWKVCLGGPQGVLGN